MTPYQLTTQPLNGLMVQVIWRDGMRTRTWVFSTDVLAAKMTKIEEVLGGE